MIMDNVATTARTWKERIVVFAEWAITCSQAKKELFLEQL